MAPDSFGAKSTAAQTMIEMAFSGAAMQTSLLGVNPQRVADGSASAALPVTLPLNAVVRTFDVVVQARRADLTAVQAIAQMRDANQDVMNGQGMAVVIDFGRLRTVSEVRVPAPLQILSVTPWIGTEFRAQPAYAVTSIASSITPGGQAQISVNTAAPSTGQLAVLPSEIRTERLLVRLLGTQDIDALAAAMSVKLPEAPSGLELRLEGGAPVWTHPAPAQPGTEDALTDAGWNRDGRLIVHAGAALAGIAGDPTGTQAIAATLVLTAQVPGALAVTEHARSISLIRRMRFDGESARVIGFEQEGRVDLPLPLPPPASGQTRLIEAIRFTAAATPPPERVLPPVGPEPAGAEGVPVLADLALTPARAAILRLRPASGLAALTGIRLPLAAGADGAEARVVLWRNREPGLLLPVEALPDGASEPVALQGGAAEAWITFAFPQPVAVEDDNPPWAALLVSRGEVICSLARAAGPDDPLDANLVRLGPPTGPWQAMPAPFQAAGGPLAGLRGRIRAVGTAPRDRPLAPLTVALAEAPNDTVEVTPTAKGAVVAIAFDPPVAAATLRLTGRVAGAVTLRDIDVVSTT